MPGRLSYAAYGALLWAALPVVWLRLLWRGRTEPGYRERRGERFGRLPAQLPSGAICFHTVSAGEAIAAAPVIRALRARFPATPFVVTTMTPTGSVQVARLLGEQVAHCHAPYDFRFAVRGFLDRIQPRLLVLMETELWPNLIALSAGRGVPVLAINARMSERSARGYRRIGALTRAMLGQLRWVACQYRDHAERFIALGASAERVEVLGSVKFDQELPADHGARLARLSQRWRLQSRPVWIAGSTHPGEEEVLLAAHRRLLASRPDALLVLVPRHPRRFDAVAALARRSGFTTQRLSQGPAAGSGFELLIGDSMGELLYLYGLAQVAFVGGSLVPVGGHNPIEPALVGIPIMMGPHRFDAADVAARFQEAGCLHPIESEERLATLLRELLSDREEAARQGRAALRVIAENRGASERLLERLSAEIEQLDVVAGQPRQAMRP